jgi:hypothetical protein
VKKILIYTHGPHKGTLEIAREIGITEYHKVDFKWGILPKRVPKADLYFLEGLVPLIKGYGYPRSSRIVIKGNCHYPYYSRNSFLKRFIAKVYSILYRNVEIIAVSDMNQYGYKELGFKRVIVCEGFMYRNLGDPASIAHGQQNFIFIGQNGFLKGVEKSIELFLEIKKRNLVPMNSNFFLVGDLEQYILGLGYELSDLSNAGVRLIGPTNDIQQYINRSKFQIHLARYEPNAVSIMEGATQGLIPMMSSDTGNGKHLQDVFGDNIIYDWSVDEFKWKRIEEILRGECRTKNFSSLSRYTNELGVKRWAKAINVGDIK